MSSSNKSPEKLKPVPGNVDQYETAGGGRIFRIPLNAFPGLWGYAYVVLVEDYRHG